MVGVGVDALNGEVAIEGWTKNSKIRAIDLCKLYEDSGVASIIYTDINRDGILTGPAIKETVELADRINIPVIVSGGVSSIEDVKEIKNNGCSGIIGIISGRAIYEHRLDVYECNKILGK